MNHQEQTNAHVSSHGTPETFDQNAKRALIDPQLRSALRHLTVTFGEKRALAIASVDDWEELARTRAGVQG